MARGPRSSSISHRSGTPTTNKPTWTPLVYTRRSPLLMVQTVMEEVRIQVEGPGLIHRLRVNILLVEVQSRGMRLYVRRIVIVNLKLVKKT